MENTLQSSKTSKLIFNKHKAWLWAILIVPILFGAPYILGSYLSSVFVIMGIYCITTVGITLLMGYAGLVSLAGAAFWGIGAYVTGVGAVHLGINPLIGIVLGIIVAALIAYGLGWIMRNLEGHHFSLATLGFGVVIN
ncbi:MAG: hypothetical protein WD907_07415, partial [Bacilli bacterium]